MTDNPTNPSMEQLPLFPDMQLNIHERSIEQSAFVDAFNDLAHEIHQTAIEKGWWNDDRNTGEAIALIHSELSEALEGLRNDAICGKVPQFLEVETELADAIIRIMDLAKGRGWRVAEALVAKMDYNKSRPYRHGNKPF